MLPITVAPRHYENIQGYILRLSETNFYGRPSWIYSLINLSKLDISFSLLRQCSIGLHEYFDAYGDALDLITYQHSGENNYKSVNLKRRGKIYSSMLDIRNPKICPECVVELGSTRSVWDLRLYQVCPKHKCYLIDKCGQHDCGRRLTWLRPFLGKCGKCQIEYAVPATTQVPSAAECHLAQLIEGQWYRTINNTEIDNISVWTELKFDDFFYSLHFLATRLLEEEELFSKLTFSQLVLIYQKMAASIVGWPDNFGRFVRLLMQRDVKAGLDFSLSNQSNFGRFYHRITDENNSARLSHFRAPLNDYVYSSPQAYKVTGKGSSQLYNPIISKEHYLTRDQVMEQLSITGATFRRLFSQGRLRGFKLKMGRQHVYRVEVDSVEAYAATRD